MSAEPASSRPAGRARAAAMALVFGTVYGGAAWAAHAIFGWGVEHEAVSLGMAGGLGYFVGRRDEQKR